MPFYGWIYGQEGHAAYEAGDSPYSRPVAIHRLEGGLWQPYEREEAALAALNAKRLPWELHDSELYRSDLLSGGFTFPAGSYRATMANNIRPAQGMPEGMDYPWVYTGWIYALERRSHLHGVLNEAPFQWYPYSVYQHSYTVPRSYRVNLWMGEAGNPDHWEPHHDEHGTSLTFHLLGGMRIAAIIARIVWVWRASSIPDIQEWLIANANVNGFVFRPTPERDYIMFGSSGPH